ncbi:hypothetical protein [Streptosporangium sp. NPDC006007]|uniref:hypothetical protein n=1 Tax=Streptosporangium sp. NPDC006007 TaxID=3154575 RepID=UPI0033BEA7C6
MPEPVHAVLFDLSGTLTRAEAAERRVAAVLAEAGIALQDADGSPGGSPGDPVMAPLREGAASAEPFRLR